PQLAYATWTRYGTAARGPTMFARTTDGGQTWEPARTIVDPGSHNFNQGHQIVVLPDGTLVNFFSKILFRADHGGIDDYVLNISLIRSLDHGQTWLPSDTPIHVADILPVSDTDTVPGIRGVPSPDGGQGVRAPFVFPDYTVDPTSGNLYAVWQDTRFSN